MAGRYTSVVLGLTLILLPSGAVQAQSPSPGESASVVASAATAVRDGWTLETNETPAFSVQLPSGWSRGAAVAGMAATSSVGESLSVTPESRPAEPDFDAWVARVETEMETGANTDLPTTFRQVGTGIVARIDEGTTAGDTEGETTAHFLFPLCQAGAISMDISGPAPAVTTNGEPDAWDMIASGVNPCDTDPAPERVQAADVVAAGPRYLAIVTPANAASAKAYEPLASDTSLKVWHKQAAKLAKIIGGLVADLKAEAWPISVQPQVDALISADQDAATLWGKTFAKAKNAKGVTTHYDDLDRVNAATRAAGRNLRLALGLPTAPR